MEEMTIAMQNYLELIYELSLDGKNPIMLIEDIGYLDNGKPIEFSISVLDVSFVDFSATFKR